MGRSLRFVVFCAAALLAFGAYAQQKVGDVLFATPGATRAPAAGEGPQPLRRGDPVYEGDVLLTGPAAHVQLRMSDDALLALRPDSSLRLRTYAFAGAEDGSERADLELVKGALRSITGAIGRTHKSRYHIRSHNTVLGIRGTDHETFFVGAGERAGTYNRVTMGGTYLETPGGRVDLDPGEAGFSALRPDAVPVRLPSAPPFMLSALPPAAPDSGPRVRERAASDADRLKEAARRGKPDGALQGLGPAASPQGEGLGYGRGGRCGGPCRDFTPGGPPPGVTPPGLSLGIAPKAKGNP